MVNSVSTYETLTEIPRFVSLDSLGILRKDVTPGGALTPIYSNIIGGSFFKSCSLFGRQYFGFGAQTGLGNPAPFNGLDLPRQYDDTNFDRISQVGPGAAPSAADENVSATIVASANGLLNVDGGGSIIAAAGVPGLSEAGNVVTVTLQGTVLSPLSKAGDPVKVVGAGVAGYNGAFTISAILNTTQFQYVNGVSGLANSGGGTAQFTIVEIVLTAAAAFTVGGTVVIAGATNANYNGTYTLRMKTSSTDWTGIGPATIEGQANSGGGTITATGNVPAGKHQLSVIFVTRNGYYTKPAPPNSWVAGGGNRVVATGIPIGPPNVMARVLCFTGVNGSSFYHLGPTGLTIPTSNMYIADNTTTQVTVDFTDAVLLAGTLDDPLFNQIVLPPVAGVIDYSNRLLAWGEQANLQGFLNLSFDGGFTNLTSASTGVGANFPLGWTQDAANAVGGGSANVGGKAVIFGDAYTITGNGVTAVRGKISQGAATNYLNNPILLPNTAYTIRARVAQTGAAAGTVHFNLQSTSLGLSAGASAGFGVLTAAYGVLTGTLTNGLAVIPSDLLLQVFVDGTPTNGSVWSIDEIEIFPTAAQFNNSNLRASKGQLNTQGQESYDSQTGLLQYGLNDGISIRTCFKIRERLYVVKEHSFGVTQDDGVNEPSLWKIDDVSKRVGTPSVNGVGIGEDWVVIAHRTGLYIFWGGNLEKISQEIQPTWDTINWQQGTTISVAVDTKRRRIYICAPFGAAVQPNKTLVLDYHDVGSDAAAIASNPPIHLTYTGAKRAFDRARKWCSWSIAANSVAQIELSNGQNSTFFGSNDGTGNINQLDDTGTVFSDNGAAIPSFYTTSFLPDRESKQGLQLSQHRILFAYLTSFIQGQGNVGVTVFLDSLSNAIALNPQALANPAVKDLEVGINQTIERMAVKFSSSGAGNFFDIQNLVLNARTDPWAPVRGA